MPLRACDDVRGLVGDRLSSHKDDLDVLSIASTDAASAPPPCSRWSSEQAPLAHELEICPTGLVLGEVVGVGAMAEVLCGALRGRAVALKRPRLSLDDRKALVQEMAFLREAETLASVSHDGVVRFLGVVRVERPPCIVTELCSGGALFDLLHVSLMDLQWSQQLKIASDVAEAMRHLHGLCPAIIHRDVKSANVLLASEVISQSCVPHAKLADFGLARAWRPGSSMTVGVGTSHWMAPEVVARGSYDCKADVFSFGMLLFEILCCEVPFEHAAQHEVTALLAAGRRPDEDPEALPPDCPDLLSKAMAACWAQEPASRPGWDSVIESIARALDALA